ncbi:hypothetical protein DSECCO2_537050 [anaerobic digester metagenome]
MKIAFTQHAQGFVVHTEDVSIQIGYDDCLGDGEQDLPGLFFDLPNTGFSACALLDLLDQFILLRKETLDQLSHIGKFVSIVGEFIDHCRIAIFKTL